MHYIAEGFVQALRLLIKGDPETFSAIFATMKVSSLSILASLTIGIPAGFFLGYNDFTGKRQVRTFFDTLLALPTVVIGLFFYSLLSRRGPLGELGLLFTIPGIALAQTLLVIPIVVSLTATAIEGIDRRLFTTLFSLGADRKQVLFASLFESRHTVLAAAVTAYSRAISEVGVSMMIGGNIKWRTRTITTAIALETAKGEFSMGIALGLVLLLFALLINWILRALKGRA